MHTEHQVEKKMGKNPSHNIVVLGFEVPMKHVKLIISVGLWSHRKERIILREFIRLGLINKQRIG